MHARREATLPGIELSPSSLSSPNHTGSHARYAAHHGIVENSTDQYRRPVVSIDILPDNALLEIFEFCVGEDLLTKQGILSDVLWRKLVHVCRRWRALVFGSPRHLKSRLICTRRTPTRKTLDVWPALPLIIHGYVSSFIMDNLIAALERRDRVGRIDLIYHDSPESGKFWAAFQKPFPELRHLWLEARCKPRFDDEALEPPGPLRAQDVSDLFLGGSAPRLQFIWMNAVRLRGLQKLLVSATNLIELNLDDIPEYDSLHRTVTCLSGLTSLQTLSLSYRHRFHHAYQENRHPSPPTRVVFPALKFFQFAGTSNYSENLIALIDAPELNRLAITFNRHVSYTPELARIVNRMPKSGVPYEARMVFHHNRIAIRVRLPSETWGHELLNIGISSGENYHIPTSGEVDSYLSCLVQVCASLSATLSTVENLYIYETPSSALSWSEDPESTRWLKLLRSFNGLKNLYLCREFVYRIASALEDLDEGSTLELLPCLQNIYLEGFHLTGAVQLGILQFTDARPIGVDDWDVGAVLSLPSW